MQKMIVSDLDGTLLDTEHKVDAFTAATFQALAAQGVQITIATGRHFLDVKGIRESLGVSAHLITSNGARVHDPDDNEIFAENIEAELAQALMQPDVSAGTLLNAYTDDGWLVERDCPELVGVYYKDSGFNYQVVDLKAHAGDGIAKILYIADHATLTAVEEKIIERFGDEVYITFSADDCLEVMAPTVSKGHALTEVLGRLRIDAAHCYAFGDGQNDIQLLAVAGNPFIMSNASPKLKAAHPNATMIGSNDEHGVAQQLRKIFAL
ncbi:Cof-type HAD-IIB family hydrolase [Deefgea rivuli]|uniref:Cof-type HAD-IIB family hydrolase n=1 Tax=Deefgea rivuli TaxID=400948 RepID=UPI0004880400|nr:Cof-type HAD-IIB family hydrolase [Deefgea rivuli]